MQISQKVLNKRDKLLTKVHQENAVKVLGRADHKMSSVMISNRRVKTASKYKISEIPHPFTSIEEYERSLQMPLGGTFYPFLIYPYQYAGVLTLLFVCVFFYYSQTSGTPRTW